MVYFPGIGYIGSPQDLLQNDWVIFIGVFLLTYAILYFSLSKFFSGEKKAGLEDLLRGKGDKTIAHPAGAIVSAVIAFFTAAAVARGEIISQYFGAILGGWIMIFVAIVLVILTLPFFKALKAALGAGRVAGVITGLVIGFLYWYFISNVLLSQGSYSLSYGLYDFLSAFIYNGGLVILLIAGAVIGFFIPTTRRSTP